MGLSMMSKKCLKKQHVLLGKVVAAECILRFVMLRNKMFYLGNVNFNLRQVFFHGIRTSEHLV